ncbi:phosphotransferase [Alteromonas sp. 345S023]|uniref:Phosphotransferase n=1 Tax=Alteromonas profundi TaxID=2696062 RepID=A0A7X5RJX8_9ALTE|nr:phosphotransferase [Alteromonas profundi]NDV90029.1 phosphotransferase [Alteromonas profundi]
MISQVNPQFIAWVEQCCNQKVASTSLIQELWSGYGACFRACFGETKQAVVVKCAKPEARSTHPRGWHTKVSHARKCASFAIERDFYLNLQPLSNNHCFIPRCIATDSDGDNTLLVMEDLMHYGFSATASSLSVEHAQTVLKWLAAFHACFFQTNSDYVWRQGTYWHLATRQEELNVMADSPLKRKAAEIDEKLRNANYQTLVHGDAKVANFCFSENFARCAAIDFQYVGHGVGIKDVAYFLGSAINEAEQSRYRESLLTVYFNELERHLYAVKDIKSLSCRDIANVVQEWRALYPFACADFHRFLAGWSPSHWKINKELCAQTHIALSTLSAL